MPVKKPRPGTRPDEKVQATAEENRRFLEHSMRVMELGSQPLDRASAAKVRQRVDQYFYICAEDGMKPSVAEYALAFGVGRMSMWKWVNDVTKAGFTNEGITAIKTGYCLINAQIETYMQNGKINPIAGIFLLKNHMNYEDKREYAVAGTALNEPKSSDELRKRYLDSVDETKLLAESTDADVNE